MWIFCQPTLFFWNFSVNIFGDKTSANVTWPLVLYVNGTCIMILLDFFENWFGCIKKCIDAEGCCLRRSIDTVQEFSNDLYEDLQPNLLQKEYKSTVDLEREFQLVLQESHQLGYEDLKSIKDFHEFLLYKL